MKRRSAVTGLAGCAGLIPGSRHYVAVSPREAAVLNGAALDVFPDDVRRDPTRYTKTLVAWAGIVRSYEMRTEDGSLVIRFDVEHRYFDWIEDSGVQLERYFLSPRGEGMFRAAWAMPLEMRDTIAKQLHTGDMLVVYGIPSEVRNDVVALYPTE